MGLVLVLTTAAPVQAGTKQSKTYSLGTTMSIYAWKGYEYRVRVVVASGSACVMETILGTTYCDVSSDMAVSNTRWTSSSSSILPSPASSYTLSSCLVRLNEVYNGTSNSVYFGCSSSGSLLARTGTHGLPQCTSYEDYWPCAPTVVGSYEMHAHAVYLSPTVKALASGSVNISIPLSATFTQQCTADQWHSRIRSAQSGGAVHAFIQYRTSSSSSWLNYKSTSARIAGNPAFAADCRYLSGDTGWYVDPLTLP